MSRNTFSLFTLGCRINFYESQAVREAFEALGYEEVAPTEPADVSLIHSCAVTAESEKKSRSYLSRALQKKREHGGVVCLFGCMGEKRREALYTRFPTLDLVSGNTKMGELARACDALVKGEPRARMPFERAYEYDTPPISRWYSPRAFVKIQDGCNSFCTYCIVPYLRGRERARDAGDILREVDTLLCHGAREIVLSGIETAAYGAENLLALAERIARDERVLRIRFGSLKPTLFTEDFCRGLSENPKIMPHFHLSVQSGSDAVLARMRRPYTKQALCTYVDTLRRFLPSVALTADLICGFPGETQADFDDTCAFAEYARLTHAHVFPYSRREGTLAADFPDQIPVAVKKERTAYLSALCERIGEEERARLLPLEKYILVEQFKGERACGHTEHFFAYEGLRAPTDRVGEYKKIEVDYD